MQRRVDASRVLLRETVVLDPSMRDQHSHHHTINAMVANAARSRGVSVRVFGHRLAVAQEDTFGYPLVPHFRYSIYDDTPDLSSGAYADQVRAHREDIAAVWRFADVRAPARVLVHSTTSAFLEGLCHAWRLQPNAMGALAVQLMFRPESMAGIDIDVTPSWARYGRAVRSLRALAGATGARLSISTSCREFVQAFVLSVTSQGLGGAGRGPVSDGGIEVHPHAVYSPFAGGSLHRRETGTAFLSSACGGLLRHCGTDGSRKADVSRVLMFSGDPKLDKGLAWVVKALPSLLAGEPANEYWLQLGVNRFARPEIEALYREIRALEMIHRRLRVVWGHVSASEWSGMFARMDRVLLPYDPVAYRHKTSGIFGDCLRYMRPDARLLMCAGGWLEREASAWRIGYATCRYGDVAGLVARLTRADDPTTASHWPPMGDPRTLSRELWDTAFGRGNDEFLLDAVLGPAV